MAIVLTGLAPAENHATRFRRHRRSQVGWLAPRWPEGV